MGRTTGSICIVANDFDYVIRNGGIGTCNAQLARLLADRGWRVHVLYCGPAENPAALADLPARLGRLGIGFTNLSDDPCPELPPVAGRHDNWYTHQSDRVRYALDRLDRVHHFDLIEFAEWQALGFRVVQAKRAGLCLPDARLLVKLHSSSQWQREGNLLWLTKPDDLKLDYCERYAFEHADVQVAPCHYMLDYARGIGWGVRDDARMIRYAFPDPTPLRPTRPGDRPPEVVFFGRLEVRKGLEYFLDAVADLDPRVPLTFLGRDTTLASGESAASWIGSRLRGRPFKVQTNWNRERALKYLTSGDRLVVIASLMDNLPNTVIECAVNGIPFLASHVGGIPELLPDPDVRGRLLFAPNARDLRRCLAEHLRRPPAERADLVERVRRLNDVAANNARVGDDYEELLAAAPVRRAASGAPRVLALPAGPAVAPGAELCPVRPAAVVATADDPLVTVCVTHYNLAPYLPATLASLAAQTYRNLEVLVIDDGSTSPVAARVFEEQRQRYPGFRFLSQANAGPGAARNRCLSEAAGTYFVPVDADNIARPEMVEWFVRGIHRHPEVTVLSCYHLAFAEDADIARGEFSYSYQPLGGPRVIGAMENVFGDSNAIYRTADLRAAGGFVDARETRCEDWETYVRLANHRLRVDVLPAHLFYYRHREESRSRTTGPAYHSSLRVVRQYLEAADLPLADRLGLWTAVCGLGYRTLSQDVLLGHLADQVRRLTEAAREAQQREAALRAQLRYRMADKLNNLFKKVPLAHLLARKTLKLTWRGLKGLKGLKGAKPLPAPARRAA